MFIIFIGFSKFSGAMCSRGVTGLDDLHSATNEFLGHFVDVVYQYRGDGERNYTRNTHSNFFLIFSFYHF